MHDGGFRPSISTNNLPLFHGNCYFHTQNRCLKSTIEAESLIEAWKSIAFIKDLMGGDTVCQVALSQYLQETRKSRCKRRNHVPASSSGIDMSDADKLDEARVRDLLVVSLGKLANMSQWREFLV